MGETAQQWRPTQEQPSSPLSPPSPSDTASDSDLSSVMSDRDLSILSTDVHKTRISYPSPSASNRSSAKTSPAPETMATASQDDERPRKKRKTADPKERTTMRIDLRQTLSADDESQLDRLLKSLHKKRKIVVIAGAGISVAAGIPDFRSSTGLFKSLRSEHKRISSGKDLFDASVYQDDSSTSSFHDMVRNLSQQTKNAQPTKFHHLLATLAAEGRLLRLYTQNVDGIDTALEPLRTQVPLPKKNPWPKTVQLHGGLDHMVCSKCHALSDFDAEQFNGPVPPECAICVENDSVRKVAEKRSHGIGRLRPRMVLYNEHNPDDEAIGSCVSADLRTRPDAVIVAGTTLKVPGVRRITREMCATVKDRKDGLNVWINNDPEPIGKDLADLWDFVVQGPCDDVATHAAMPRWDKPISYEEKAPTNSQTVVVAIPATPSKVRTIKGQLTPGQSPRMDPRQFNETDNPEPNTPSKKRKSDDTKPSAFVKMDSKPVAKVPKRAPQSKKATGPKGKAKKETKKMTETPINAVLKTTKSAASKASSKPKVKIPKSDWNLTVSASSTTEEASTNSAGKVPNPSTPKKHAKVTKFKKDPTLAQIPDSDLRNNNNNNYPIRPTPESLSPVKRTPEEQLRQEEAQQLQQEEARPTSAGSRKSIPMGDILNPVLA